MAIASAPGKLILFGEHFVVHGQPAIAAAIGSRTVAKVSRAGSYYLVDSRPETPGYKEEKFEQQTDSMQRIFKAMGLAGNNVRIELGGDLVAASGVGASGASCAAIAAALNEEFGLNLDRETINEVAYEGEKGYHGTPSGIDNSCSTFGGYILFRKDLASGKSIIELLSSNIPLAIVVGNTGITSNTSEIVADVKKSRESDPEKFGRLFDEYANIVAEAKTALEEKALPELGNLMNRNHALLREIDVSSSELEELVDIALKNGALGAKLTGTGRGGLMIALVTDDFKENVASGIESAGYKSEITELGAEGVKVLR